MYIYISTSESAFYKFKLTSLSLLMLNISCAIKSSNPIPAVPTIQALSPAAIKVSAAQQEDAGANRVKALGHVCGSHGGKAAKKPCTSW